MQLPDYQRLEKVKIFLEIKSWTDFSRVLGLKNSQIFTDIKNGKSHISPEIATKICSYAPQISFEWLLKGTGAMAGVYQQTSVGDNNSHSGNITNNEPNERLLKLLEEAQEERKTLLEIIKNLSMKA